MHCLALDCSSAWPQQLELESRLALACHPAWPQPVGLESARGLRFAGELLSLQWVLASVWERAPPWLWALSTRLRWGFWLRCAGVAVAARKKTCERNGQCPVTQPSSHASRLIDIALHIHSQLTASSWPPALTLQRQTHLGATVSDEPSDAAFRCPCTCS